MRKTLLTILLAAAAAPLGAQPVRYQESFMNLPASTTAFEFRFDLNGDGRRDVVAIFQRRIMIFLQSEKQTFPSVPDVEIGSGSAIPDNYAAVAIGRVSQSPGMQLILIGPDGVDYLTLDQLRNQTVEPVTPKPLIRGKFDISSSPNIVFLDAAVDMNGDGKTDLVLPNSDLLEVYTADSEGTFTVESRVTLPVTTVQETRLRVEPPVLGSLSFGDGGPQSMVRTLPHMDRWHGIQFAVETLSDPFLVVDYNGDKRMDVVTPKTVYFQGADGKFTGSPADVYSRIAMARAAYKGRLVDAPNLVDFNADGILDTFAVQSSSAKLSPRTDVPVYLGKPDRSFPKEADFVLRTRDFAYSEVIPVGDLDGDGCPDIALLHLDFQASSASSQLKAYIRSGLEGDLRFYLWDKLKNRFPDAPSFKHPVTVNYEIYGARQLFQQQIVMNQDMDGDGRADLVMKTGPQQISVYKNLGGTQGFTAKPVALIKTPTRFSSIIVSDLNGDKKGDVIISGYREDEEDRIIYSFYLSM